MSRGRELDMGRPPFIGVWRSGLPKEAAGQGEVE